MKAAIYPGNGKPIVIAKVPDPEPSPDDLIIRVHRCGICGTDLHMTEGHGRFQFPAGTILGHEFAGEVVATGRSVSGWKIGDRLTAVPSQGAARVSLVRMATGRCAEMHRGKWGALPNICALQHPLRFACRVHYHLLMAH